MTLHRPGRVLTTAADREMWAYLDRGELRLQYCAACGLARFPPAGVCEACLSGSWTWRPATGRGSVLSWVTYHRPYFPSLEHPYTVVVAQLPEGVLLTADLTGDGGSLDVGAALELRFDDAEFDDGGRSMLYRWALASPDR